MAIGGFGRLNQPRNDLGRQENEPAQPAEAATRLLSEVSDTRIGRLEPSLKGYLSAQQSLAQRSVALQRLLEQGHLNQFLKEIVPYLDKEIILGSVAAKLQGLSANIQGYFSEHYGNAGAAKGQQMILNLAEQSGMGSDAQNMRRSIASQSPAANREVLSQLQVRESIKAYLQQQSVIASQMSPEL